MGGNRGAFYFWVGIGVLVALVMPLTAVLTAITVQAIADDSVPFLMLIILAIISVAAHVLVLFGGTLAHASKTYCYYAAKRARLVDVLVALRKRLVRLVKRLEDSFIPYVHHWRKHNQHYTYVEAGPFDHDVAELLRRRFPHLNRNTADDGPHHA